MAKKVIIIGGVAGGASTAARLRRLDEEMEIILLEKGAYVSYANCGLPYYIGGAIEEREALFVMTPEKFENWFAIDIRTRHEAVKIDPDHKEVEVVNLNTGETYRESYEYLVLSPGAEPIRPPLEGIENEKVFSLRNVDDTDKIYNFIQNTNPRRAVVVGAGFIGLEMAENLQERSLEVSVVELAPQVLPPIDPDMAALVQQYMRGQKMNLRLGDGVNRFDEDAATGRLRVELSSGEVLDTDMVVLSIGVKPDTKLALGAGLEVRRGIVVNSRMQTSDPDIFALGDAVEVKHFITGKPVVVPLAGPANKQGRIVANNIAGRKCRYFGTQGTSVLKIFEMTVAATGANERLLKAENIEYKKVIVHPDHHAGYYPGAKPISLKLFFSSEGNILGAQAVGYSGVEKRIDVIATALRAGLTVFDLRDLELAYAPPYSSAKDPVNMAGYVASNLLDADYETLEAADLLETPETMRQIVDVREPDEYEEGHIAGSVNIPLGTLRSRLGELDPEKETVTYCSIGLRSYFAKRILKQRHFKKIRNLNGGYLTYQALEKENKFKA